MLVNTAQANSSGIYQIQVPGPLGVGSYAYHVEVIDRYGDVSSPSAALMITVGSVTPTPPTIISEQVLFTRKVNKRHKPVGKPVLMGFEFDFSAAMNPSSAGNPSNYEVDWISSKRVKRKHATQLHSLPVIVQYSAATDAVTVLLTEKQTFNQGGRITVVAGAPNGVSSATGVMLDGNDEGTAGDNGVFSILPKARGIIRG